jgi:hypothetical protein
MGVQMSGYTKKAVIYTEAVPFLNCECGNKLSLPKIEGLPMTFECLCGIEYDSRGWILSRKPIAQPTKKTKAGWDASRLDLSRYLEIGDEVDEELADYFLGVLPPAFYNNSIIQIGEPYDHVNGRPTYSTIARIVGVTSAGPWKYAGHCYCGQTTEPEASRADHR